MIRPPGIRFWLKSLTAAASLVLAILTLSWPHWIEIVFRIDPDRGDGVAEWGVVAAMTAAFLVLGALAGAEWRRARPAITS